MEDWINDLRYIIMPSNHPLKGYEKEYEQAYQCWRMSWEKYRNEVGVTDPLYSDNFIIPDEMGVLFWKDKCIGLACFTYGQVNHPTLLHNSWFKGWPEHSLARLCKISPNIVIGSQFTVSPEFTGKKQIVRWKEILFLYTFMRFDKSMGGVMAGTLNLQRGMNNAAGESFGATIIAKEIPYHYGEGLSVQLVAYERSGLKKMINQKGISEMCENLWSRTLHLSDFPVIENHIGHLKIAA